MQTNVLAIDLGASSGRAIVGRYSNDQLALEEVHRFKNSPIEKDGGLYWDVDTLFKEILTGIKKASDAYKISSVGIDTWGVDFGLINADGELIDLPINYRDKRTQGLAEHYAEKFGAKQLYQATGNQIMDINTLFRLLMLKDEQPEQLEKAEALLMMPDLFNYLLTGKKRAEVSIASTTQAFNPFEKEWNQELIKAFDLPVDMFPEVAKAGMVLGQIKEELAEEYGFKSLPVSLVCGHDTANAIFTVNSSEEVLFAATGTWIIVGVERDKPVISETSMKYNLTNEMGYDGKIHFTKNITGLWITQELQRAFYEAGRDYEFGEMMELAREAKPFVCLLDTDHPSFAEPGEMIEKIKQFAGETGQNIPETDGEFIRVIYEGLALKHKETFNEIEETLYKEFDTVHLFGGGINATLLCQMISDASGKRVITGSGEATALGNIAIQLVTLGVYSSVEEAKENISQLDKPASYFPHNDEQWSNKYKEYKNILNK